MDMIGGISFQAQQPGITGTRIKVEKEEKDYKNFKAGTSSEKSSKTENINTYPVLSKLNVENSKVTLEQAEKALGNIMDAMKKNPEKALLSQFNVNAESVAKTLN